VHWRSKSLMSDRYGSHPNKNYDVRVRIQNDRAGEGLMPVPLMRAEAILERAGSDVT